MTLYWRDGCHLCEEMGRELTRRREALGVELEAVEISGDVELEARYGHKVPVLCAGDEEICHYFLDEEALARHLAAPHGDAA
ncbi:glutaredoxin family protein [Endothiovibrio diazotrophicus]